MVHINFFSVKVVFAPLSWNVLGNYMIIIMGKYEIHSSKIQVWAA